METSANNRYELLFVDDDAGALIDPDNAGTAKKDIESIQKTIKKNEKENKLNTLNTNKAPTKIAPAKLVKKNNGSAIGITESRERHNRMKTSQNSSSYVPEYNNELPQRQTKDRDSKTTPRFREKFGKREFDRQSGSDKTGIKPIDKRDGAGAHNWGSAKQDIQDVKTGATAPVTDKEDSANEQPGDTTNKNLEEDEVKQMTLDEWKAIKEQRAKPNYNLRKAGEGVDNLEWKKMTVLSKKKGIGTEDDLEYDASMYPQRVGRLQRIVDIQFNFNDGRKSGFRKGMRPPGRENPRKENTSNNGFEKIASHKFGEKHRSGLKTLKVDDEVQFPTLA